MYKSVYELTQEQLDELKQAIWYDDDASEVIEELSDWEEIPNSFVREKYTDTNFTDDDFFCTAQN